MSIRNERRESLQNFAQKDGVSVPNLATAHCSRNDTVLQHSNLLNTAAFRQRYSLMFLSQRVWIVYLKTCGDVMRDASLENFTTPYCVSLQNFAKTHSVQLPHPASTQCLCKILQQYQCGLLKFRNTHVSILFRKNMMCVAAKIHNHSSLRFPNLAILRCSVTPHFAPS